MITMEKVGKYYGSFKVLSNCTTQVERGEVVVVCGPSGTGKTFLTRLLLIGIAIIGRVGLGFVLPWALESIATTAAENRNDQATVDELRSAAKDLTRWINFRPFDRLPPMQPDNPAVAPWYFDWIRHWTRDQFWQNVSIRDRYPTVTVPVSTSRPEASKWVTRRWPSENVRICVHTG